MAIELNHTIIASRDAAYSDEAAARASSMVSEPS